MEVHWERSSLPRRWNRVYGSNQCCCAGACLHSIPKHYPAGGRLRLYEETGKRKKKSRADVNEVCEPFDIQALHLTSDVFMHRVWQALGVHYH